MGQVIEAEGLVIRDSRGIVRARLGFVSEDQGYVGLTLCDGGGNPRICISTAAAGSYDRATILINDPEGVRRATLNVAREGAGLRLFDRSERPVAMLGVPPEGGARLTLLGSAGEVLFAMPEDTMEPGRSDEPAGSVPE